MNADVFASLEILQKGFLCALNLKTISFTDILNKIASHLDPCVVQEHLLKYTVLHPLAVKYPLKKSYVRSFLKCLINELETEDIEVSDQVYSFYLPLVEASDDEVTEDFHYRHFVLNECILTLKESIKLVTQGTTGLCSGQGALALADWCLSNTNLLKGKHILELGSGVGLTGLAVASTGIAASYCFSDGHYAVVQLLKENIELNAGSYSKETSFNGTPVQVIKLNWEDTENIELNLTDQPDLILASDIVYDDSLFPSLVRTLRHFLSSAHVGVQAVLACTVRNPDTLQRFLELLAANKFTVKEQLDNLEHKVFLYSSDTPIKIFIVQL